MSQLFDLRPEAWWMMSDTPMYHTTSPQPTPMNANAAADPQPVIKLPMLEHMVPLRDFAANGATEHTYGIVAGPLHMPKNGLGYIVESVDRRHVRILALATNDLRVYDCSNVIDDTDGLTPSLHLSPWRDVANGGCVHVHAHDHIGIDNSVVVGEYETNPAHNFRFVSAVENVGSYGSANHEALPFIAAAWLQFVHIPQANGIPVGASGGRIRERLQALLEQPLPDALDELIYRGTTNSATVSDFERFAARQLMEAGASEVRAIASKHIVRLVRLSSTNLFWLRFNTKVVVGLQYDVLMAVEAALNRLVAIQEAAAQVDNGMAFLKTANEAFCDAHANDFVHNAASCIEKSTALQQNDNPYMRFGNHQCGAARHGGNWDAMTRFARACERLRLPARLEYRFDIDTTTGVMAVRFAVPPTSAFIASRFTGNGWKDTSSYRRALQASYALRLAGVLAHAAFTSSMSVTSVNLTGYVGGLYGDAALSVGFERMPFMMSTLPTLSKGFADDPELDVDPLRIFNLLQPSRYAVQFTSDRGLRLITPLPVQPQLTARYTQLWQDDRALPEDLCLSLHASKASDLGILHENGIITAREITSLSRPDDESSFVTSFEIESTLMKLNESIDETQEGEPLYCEHPAMRMLVDLVAQDKYTRYWKMPDAVYTARMTLARYALKVGNYERALAEQHELVRIAPTTSQSYVELSITYAQMQQYDMAVDTLMRGLRVAILPMDVAYAYYRLAFALWQTGDREHAYACYIMSLAGPYMPHTDMAQVEMQSLLDEMSTLANGGLSRDYANMTYEEAVQVLRSADIPAAPSEHALNLIATNTVRLVDEGIPHAAFAGAWLLACTNGNDDVLAALPESLRLGVGDYEAGEGAFMLK